MKRRLYMCAALLASLGLIPALTSARNSFTSYADVQHLLPFLKDVLPPQLNSSQAWTDWITRHDSDIRQRLLRGDEDTIVNWLLFGTSFTKSQVVSRRVRDFIDTLTAANPSERALFVRRLLESRGLRFNTRDERTKLERHLLAEVDRVVSERQQYAVREDGFQKGDLIGQVMVESTLFRDRGLSLDTSILASFAIEQALEAMKDDRLLPPNSIRRVAIIGPGLDFADKNTGYDFYPIQTMQPFTSIDSIVRHGLAANARDVEITTFDISPQVNDHIQAMKGNPYTMRLPINPAERWTSSLMSYWKSMGDRIGKETMLPKSSASPGKAVELRAVAVRPEVAARITPVDFNIVTEKWTGPPFDLVIATNVFVYYDKLDQTLAFAGIEGMLRPGGFFVTNNVIVELPVSRLRSAGLMTVRHSVEKIDHVFWYRRNP